MDPAEGRTVIYDIIEERIPEWRDHGQRRLKIPPNLLAIAKAMRREDAECGLHQDLWICTHILGCIRRLPSTVCLSFDAKNRYQSFFFPGASDGNSLRVPSYLGFEVSTAEHT
jgi:hypothetical protein